MYDVRIGMKNVPWRTVEVSAAVLAFVSFHFSFILSHLFGLYAGHADSFQLRQPWKLLWICRHSSSLCSFPYNQSTFNCEFSDVIHRLKLDKRSSRFMVKKWCYLWLIRLGKACSVRIPSCFFSISFFPSWFCWFLILQYFRYPQSIVAIY